jgi:hypothetical protein
MVSLWKIQKSFWDFYEQMKSNEVSVTQDAENKGDKEKLKLLFDETKINRGLHEH